jgi:pimeloyl-ACP methyl ester carboxylesterase
MTMNIKPSSKGLLAVNGIQLYHEVYGDGDPLVLLHGGLMTIPEMMAILAPLATTRKVIALELQGHGHSPDTDRPVSFETFGDDVAAVIDKLGLGRADVAGLSLGGTVAIRVAIQHPNKVRRLALISSPYAKHGWYPEAQKGMGAVGASFAEPMKDTPTGKLAREWPEPERFPKFLDKFGAMMGRDYDWSSDIPKLPMPVMLVFADHDSVSQKHIAEFFALLGGGISEPGWQNTKFTRARLAVISGYSHYNFVGAPEIGPVIGKFLADPMTGASAGAAAASAVSPAPEHK